MGKRCSLEKPLVCQHFSGVDTTYIISLTQASTYSGPGPPTVLCQSACCYYLCIWHQTSHVITFHQLLKRDKSGCHLSPTPSQQGPCSKRQPPRLPADDTTQLHRPLLLTFPGKGGQDAVSQWHHWLRQPLPWLLINISYWAWCW